VQFAVFGFKALGLSANDVSARPDTDGLVQPVPGVILEFDRCVVPLLQRFERYPGIGQGFSTVI
jgi:hypothetical protein